MDDFSSAHLLGSCLGDGSIPAYPRTFRLTVACDVAYPEIVESVHAANEAGRTRRPRAAAPASDEPVPLRRELLEGLAGLVPLARAGPQARATDGARAWQPAVVDAHAWRFLAGLLHSDGCRTINRFKTELPSGRVAEYAYPRWFFSNQSADILGQFCDTCDALGIRWTRSSHRNVPMSHRRSVALRDAHIGMKA